MCKNKAEQTQMLAMVRLFKKTAAASRRPATKKKTELAIANAAPSAGKTFNPFTFWSAKTKLMRRTMKDMIIPRVSMK